MATRSAFSYVVGCAIVVAIAVLISALERSRAESHTVTPRSDEILKPSNEGDGYLAAKERYEQHWREKIERAISFVQGPVVEVEVSLSPDVVFREETIEYGERPIVSEMESVSTSWWNKDVEDLCDDDTDESVRLLEGEESTEEMTYHSPSSVERTIERVPFVPKAVYVAIVAPRSCLNHTLELRGQLEEIDQSLLHQVEMELTAAIQDIVVTLVPHAPAGEDMFPRVKVIWYD